MSQILPRKSFRAGKTIFRKGDVGDVAYVIQSGTVDIVRTVAGQNRLIANLAAGEIFGEMALIDGKPRMADAIAAGDVVVLAVPADQFQEKLRTADPFIRALLRMFVTNLRVSTEKLVALEMRREFEAKNAAAAAGPATDKPS
jgi:CRP/FNR family transcriptional regulator, cyclic AMP receptor protein